MIQAERSAAGNRDAKLRAAHDCFYRGEIAREIDRFHKKNDGFLRIEDLENFDVPVEAPISCGFRGSEIYSCDVWCQGIVLLESLKILEPIDLASLGHNSTAYLHTIAGALNLAFADQEAYVGDPKFVDVPRICFRRTTRASSGRGWIRTRLLPVCPGPARSRAAFFTSAGAPCPGPGRQDNT